MRFILFIGPPGSGKGTQAQRLSQTLGYKHLVMGDLLRQEIQSGSRLGEKVRPIVESGGLVPDEWVIELIGGQIRAGENYILDGFPRTLKQAEALQTLIRAHQGQLCAVVALEVPETELVTRLLRRREMEGRTDDNEVTIRHRLQEYEAKTLPLLAYYETQALLHRISGIGEVEEITNRIQEVLTKCLIEHHVSARDSDR